MAVWFALVAVPLLALIDQSVAYVTALWACTHQSTLAVQGVHVPFLVAAIVASFVAGRQWRASAERAKENDVYGRRHFLAGVATGVAALSALVIAVMWAGTWVLRPCVY